MLEDLLDERNIIRILCNKRIKLRQKNRKNNFINSISSLNTASSHSELHDLLPPRKYWPRPSKKNRLVFDDNDLMYSKYLFSHVLRHYNDHSCKYNWKINLIKFINECKERFDNINERAVAPVKVVAIPKDASSKCKKFRVVAIYSLVDSVINSLVAKHLSELIDCSLSDCCYSFRPSKKGIPRTHHDAVENIMSFSSSISKNSTLWVAECDIQGFFDCISHDLITSKLQMLKKNSGIRVDSKTIQYVEKFLSGYSYKKAKIAAEEYLKTKFVSNPILFDNEKILQKFGVLDTSHNFGVPQGSALSTVFANLVLNDTDKKIESILGNNVSFYARFCDDVILISTDKNKCSSAINKYCSDLSDLKLPYHELESVSFQNKKFWNTKSKKPYRWIHEGKEGGVYWIGFVGYQVKRNGIIRIRKSSLEKEINKQSNTISAIVKSIKKKTSVALEKNCVVELTKMKSIEKKVHSHLVARSVGVKNFGRKSTKFKTWGSGFKLLTIHEADRNQLKSLDTARTRAMKRLRGHLCEIAKNDRVKFCNLKKEKNVYKFMPYYFGKPYSYYVAFDS